MQHREQRVRNIHGVPPVMVLWAWEVPPGDLLDEACEHGTVE
eukprot:CAMPEP_0177283050 /NCGR_PEP_ID=MMETSP0367-20130122/71795_1 /TAXON_ID=447022 ORGANISM="Scrippsiella hangoei-like, Strain SHHI-4" /NCGR_SAMPLE_ID=MMETSP0367 /ASSEMBLY_ACC=CAM_ASM_000362 /LENGTH=41 /DNA_ID= /DNA_START= /DNA_END= /DNA_ORIENTATION=